MLTGRRITTTVSAIALTLLAIGTTAAHQIEVLPGSSIGTEGTVRTIPLQTIPTIPGPGPSSFRTVLPVALPEIPFGFQESIRVLQHRDATVVLNTTNGLATMSLRLWVVDSSGNRLDLPVTLTTSLSSSESCAGQPLCLDDISDPPQCRGQNWDPFEGEMEFIQRIKIPCNAETILDEDAIIDIVLRLLIVPGDADSDGVQDIVDKCPNHSNASQTDSDQDGIGNTCDNCMSAFNPLQRNTGGDPAKGDACEPLQINFQPDAAAIPPGYLKDAGLAYTSARGYGWLGAPNLMTRERNIQADQRLDTFVFSSVARTWEGGIAAGLYDVQVVSGDPAAGAGPHRVSVEGVTAIADQNTSANQYATGNVERRLVGDGRLTVGIGGAGGNTMLNYLIATESQPDNPATNPELRPFHARYVNFQPCASAVPRGFEKDCGTAFDPLLGIGWDAPTPLQTRDRALGNPVLDTFVFETVEPQAWHLGLPADFYSVQLAIGDTAAAQGPESVVVEGSPWLTSETTAIGETLTASGLVLVLDGFLDVAIGEAGGNTPLNYVVAVAAAPDYDADGANNWLDNCPDVANPTQDDSDSNGVGNACNSFEDPDGDEYADLTHDTCPGLFDPTQADADQNRVGDACNSFEDPDGDEYAEPNDDNCPGLSNPTQADADHNGLGDACNSAEDLDNDEFADLTHDNCPALSNPTQADGDGDGAGNECDCMPTNPTVKSAPGEVGGVAPGGEAPTLVSWSSSAESAGSGTQYDVVTHSLSGLRSGATPYQSATCMSNDVSALFVSDSRPVPLGDGYIYLVRAVNACGIGTFGPGSGRTALNGAAPCP